MPIKLEKAALTAAIVDLKREYNVLVTVNTREFSLGVYHTLDDAIESKEEHERMHFEECIAGMRNITIISHIF